jgi:adenylate cyclase, class 2
MLEIELKVFVGKVIDTVLRQAESLGWNREGESEQSDTYYTSAHKDFISSEECLRIRITDSKSELTWKPPTTDAMREAGQYWKEEIDLNLDGQADTMMTLLARLDFQEFVTVEKRRIVFRIDDASIVCFDCIGGLGWFVEIETKGESSDAATARNVELLNQLEIQSAKPVSIPYRDLVKEAERKGSEEIAV